MLVSLASLTPHEPGNNMAEKLYSWTDIRDIFKHTLVLGNGASIAVDSCFSYTSLYDEASKALLLNDAIKKLFSHYSTTDFEFILRLVWRTHQINSLFAVKDDAVSAAYSQIRESLIKTVQQVHVGYAQAVDHLPAIAGFLRRFKSVISLNYDLLIYWAMLHGNKALGGPWFKDCFIHKDRTFEDDFDFLRKPYGKVEGATLVFYPHGNLVLATSFLGQETKICSDEKADLLENIIKRWNLNDSTPLFVSEGSSSQKLQAIHRNGYLRTIYNDLLKDLDENPSICVYGWSMSDQDIHLLEAIGKNKPKYLAVSVYSGSDNWQGFCEKVRSQINKVFGFKYCKVFFFDSQSDACWLNCTPIG